MMNSEMYSGTFLGSAFVCFYFIAWAVLALGFPIYASIHSMETSSKNHMRKLIAYWIIFSFISMFEHIFGRFMAREPLWPCIKLNIISLLVLPRFDGACYIYQHIVHPYFFINGRAVMTQLFELKEQLFLEMKIFLALTERYIEENGQEAFASKVQHSETSRAKEKVAHSDYNHTSTLSDIVDNNKLLETTSFGEVHVTSKDLMVLDLHSQGEKHKAKYRDLSTITKETAKSMGEILVDVLNQANQAKCINSHLDGPESNTFEKYNKKFEDDVTSKDQIRGKVGCSGSNTAGTEKSKAAISDDKHLPGQADIGLNRLPEIPSRKEVKELQAKVEDLMNLIKRTTENLVQATEENVSNQANRRVDFCSNLSRSEQNMSGQHKEKWQANLTSDDHNGEAKDSLDGATEPLINQLQPTSQVESSTAPTEKKQVAESDDKNMSSDTGENRSKDIHAPGESYKEWNCGIFQVKTNNLSVLNSHLQGKKHKAKCEKMTKLSEENAENTGEPSTGNASNYSNEGLDLCSEIDESKQNFSGKCEGMFGDNMTSEDQKHWTAEDSGDGANEQLLSGSPVSFPHGDQFPLTSQVDCSEFNSIPNEKKTVYSSDDESADSEENKPKEVPALKEVNKEWYCDICQVKIANLTVLNSHLQGKKHKAKCEKMNLSQENTNNTGNTSTETASNHSNQGLDLCSQLDGSKQNLSGEYEGMLRDNVMSEGQKHWKIKDSGAGANVQLFSSSPVPFPRVDQFPIASQPDCSESNSDSNEKKKVTSLDDKSTDSEENRLNEMPGLTEVTKEWNCDICQVKTNNLTVYNSHLQGKKHKANCEKMKLSQGNTKNTGETSTENASDHSSRELDFCSKQNWSGKYEGKFEDNMTSEDKKHWNAKDSGANEQLLSGGLVSFPHSDQFPVTSQDDCSESDSGSTEKKEVTSSDDRSTSMPRDSEGNGLKEMPAPTEVNMDWNCAISQVRFNNRFVLSSHFRGAEHKAKINSLKKMRKRRTKKRGQPLSENVPHEAHQRLEFRPQLEAVKSNRSGKPKGKVQLNFMIDNQMEGTANDCDGGVAEKPNLPCELCNITCTSKEEMSAHLKGRKHLSKYPELIKWPFPLAGTIKLNTDACLKDNRNIASIGGIFRDDTGRWIMGYMGRIKQMNIVAAEIYSIWQGLKLVKSRGYKYVTVETDSLSAVHLIKGNKQSHQHLFMRPMIEDCKSLLREYALGIQHIKREGNFCAYKLANMGAAQRQPCIVLDRLPRALAPWLMADSGTA